MTSNFDHQDQIPTDEDDFISSLREAAGTPAACRNAEQVFYSAGWAAAMAQIAEAKTSAIAMKNENPWLRFSTGSLVGFTAACLLWLVQVNLPVRPTNDMVARSSIPPSTDSPVIEIGKDQASEDPNSALNALPIQPRPLSDVVEAVDLKSVPKPSIILNLWQQILLGVSEETSRPIRRSVLLSSGSLTHTDLWQFVGSDDPFEFLDHQSLFGTNYVSIDMSSALNQPPLKFGPITSELIKQFSE